MYVFLINGKYVFVYLEWKNKFILLLYIINKINFRWFINLNVKGRIIKILVCNIEYN